MMRISIFLLIVLLNKQVLAANIHLNEGANTDLCNKIFNTANSEGVKDLYESISILSGKDLKKRVGKETFFDWSSHGHLLIYHVYYKEYKKEDQLDYAKFDIDNDGDDEFIVAGFAWLSQRPSRYFKIFESEIDMKGGKKFTRDEFNSIPGIYSTAPWPYKEIGLYGIGLYEFVYNQEVYLALVDNQFGQAEFLERSFLIGKYSGEGKTYGESNYLNTDNLDIVCRFSYQKNQANKEIQSTLNFPRFKR